MRTISNAISSSLLVAALALALALAGCSYGGSDTSSTRSAPINPLRKIALESPAIVGGGEAIPARYTCDGTDTSLPLTWSSAPLGTKEQLLLILSLAPVPTSGGAVRQRLVVQWAVAGLSPTLRQLAPGSLPRGAIRGRNAQGQSSYSICPPKGARRDYALMLFASPRKLALHRGFSDEALFARLSRTKPPYGQIFATYSRG